MQFKVEKRPREKPPEFSVPENSFDTARNFSKIVYKEFGDFIKAIVLFGSVAKKSNNPKDIDILIIIDDVKFKFSAELVEAYRLIVEKAVADTDRQRLHIQSMKFSNFWEYMRAGDPVAVNILRYGIALVDTGFIDPLQMLLDQGRIRPSKEAIQTYFAMAPASLGRANNHLLQATVDLYWAVIDASHAALMKYGEVPPSPEHVAELMEKTLIPKRQISRKSVNTIRTMYKVFKSVVNREVNNISSADYERYKKISETFVKEIKKYIEKKEKI